MTEGKKDGMGVAVAELHDPDVPPQAPPLQPALFPAEGLAALQALNPAQRQEQLRQRSAGRPAGSRNKSTQAWRDHILGRYSSPLVFLAEAYSRSVHDLARELGCTLLEAYDRQVKAAAELAPYLHGKMPVELQVNGALPLLAMIPPEVAAAAYKRAADGTVSVDLAALVPYLQNQGLIDVTPGSVEQPQSNGAANVQQDQGDSVGGPLIGDQQP